MISCANPSAQFLAHQQEIESAVLNVLRGSQYILGKEVEALEDEFAKFLGVKSVIGVANGTDAIEISLLALGVRPGDEVITVSHTAVATVAAIESIGAIPVLVDISPDTYTMNPDQLDEVLTSKTKVVIPVHLYGQSADLQRIMDFCEKNKLYLIEDVSQAHGAKWQGKRLGSIGHIGCFSCYPTKNLGAVGDAGLISSNDNSIAEKVRKIRQYGWKERNSSLIPGRNSRIDELQAAILRVKLRYLDDSNNKRIQIARSYTDDLINCNDIQLPIVKDGNEHVYHLYVIKSRFRDELLRFLSASNIYPGIHYPTPIHLQPAYKNRLRTSINMSTTETVCSEILSLPIYPELLLEERSIVTKNITNFFECITKEQKS